MVAYTAVFRAVADFQSAIRGGQKLGQSFRDAAKDADRAGSAGDTFGKKVVRGAKAAQQAADKTGRALSLGLTVPIVAIGGAGVRTFARFETQIVSAGSKSNATADQLERMKKVALDVGNSTKFSATEAAEGMDVLAAAGFNAEDAMGTLGAVTDAAQASNSNLALTANTVARAMNAYNIPVEKAAHVSDLFASALNTTALDMQGLQDALGNVGEIGPRFNQSIEDTVATVGRLVDMGVPAASAGTAVRQALTSLASPASIQASNLMADLGLQVRDATGAMLPLPDLIRNVDTALDDGGEGMKKFKETVGLSGEELKAWAKQNGVSTKYAIQMQRAVEGGGQAFRDHATKVLFGVEGAKAFSLAMSDGKPVLIDSVKEVEKLTDLTDGLAVKMGRDAAEAFVKAHMDGDKFVATGADAVEAVSALGVASDGMSKKIAAAFQTTTAQKIDNLKGSVETLAITLTQILKPGIDSNVESLAGFVQMLSRAAGDHPELTKVALAFLAITAAIGPTLFIGSKLVTMLTVTATAGKAVVGAMKNAVIWTQLYGEAAAKAVKGGPAQLLASFKAIPAAAGLYGTAIVGLLGLLVSVGLKQRAARVEMEGFTDTLKYQAGVLDENSKVLLVQKLAQEGALEASVKAGVGERDYVRALLGGKAARDAMIDQLDAIYAANIASIDAGEGDAIALQSQADAARDASDALSLTGASLDKSAASADLVKSATDGAAESTRLLAEQQRIGAGTSAEVAQASLDLTDTEKQLSEAESSLATQVQNVINKFTILKTGYLDSQAAGDAYKQTVLGMKEAVKKNGKSLSDNTQAGLDNRAMLRGSVSALNDKITAQFKATEKEKGHKAAVDQATKSLKAGRKGILDAAEAAGLNRTAVGKMIDKMLKTPKELETQINTPGIKDAQTQLKDLQKKIKELKNKLVEMRIEFSTNAGTVAKKLGYRQGARSHGGKADRGVPIFAAEGGRIMRGRVQHKAAGGPVQNFSGRGRQSFDTEPAMLRVDEHVWTPEEVDGAGGHDKVFQLRKAAKKGLLSFAEGGGVRPTARRKVTVRGNADKPPVRAVHEVAGPIAGRALKSLAYDWADRFGDAIAAQFRKKIAENEDGGGGPIGKGSYKTAERFARAQVGKPYIFGAAGPRGYDCSGFMAAIQNVIQGKPPYHRRYSTPAFSGSKAQGFTRGKKSPFMVGVNPSPGRFGHMAGTLNGINVESAGGVGVRMGKSARGYNASMFSWRGGLAAGGPVLKKPKGDLPYDSVDPHGKSYNPQLAALAEKLYGARYGRGTRSSTHGLHLAGEQGAELIRTGSNADISNSRQTLDYLSKIEQMATGAPRQLASLPYTPVRAAPVERQPANVTVNAPIYYAKDKELTTMAAQRVVVRSARKAFSDG